MLGMRLKINTFPLNKLKFEFISLDKKKEIKNKNVLPTDFVLEYVPRNQIIVL